MCPLVKKRKDNTLPGNWKTDSKISPESLPALDKVKAEHFLVLTSSHVICVFQKFGIPIANSCQGFSTPGKFFWTILIPASTLTSCVTLNMFTSLGFCSHISKTKRTLVPPLQGSWGHYRSEHRLQSTSCLACKEQYTNVCCLITSKHISSFHLLQTRKITTNSFFIQNETKNLHILKSFTKRCCLVTNPITKA